MFLLIKDYYQNPNLSFNEPIKSNDIQLQNNLANINNKSLAHQSLDMQNNTSLSNRTSPNIQLSNGKF